MNVLVVGGDAIARAEVAEAFHRESPLRLGPMLRIDARTEPRPLLDALRRWSAGPRSDGPVNALRAAERGTLFIDSILSLEREAQRLLLAQCARCLDAGLESLGGGPGRLIVGTPDEPSLAVADGSFSPALYDCLDKVRIGLPALARGAA